VILLFLSYLLSSITLKNDRLKQTRFKYII
jgi:hypothetical protein